MIAFSHCYLASLLMHYGKRWKDPDITVTLLGLLLWATLRRNRLEPFLVGQLLVLATTLGDYPRLANHSALQMFVALFVIVLATSAFVRKRRISCAHLAAGLRGLAVVVYFYVGLHKINTGFLNPVTSCANWYHRKFLSSAFDYSGALPDIIFHWSPAGVIVVELAACALLMFRRTWIPGLCVALPVHLYVSLSGFADFSSVMHSIMLLFLPISILSHRGMFLKSLSVYQIVVAAIAVGTYYMVSHWHLGHDVVRTFQGGTYDAIVLVVIVFLVVELRRWRGEQSRTSKREHRERRCYYAVFPALIFLWAAIPYTGLSTNGSLTMFSNLVTAPGRGNHLLIDTDATGIFDFQNDLVRVVDMEPMLAGGFRYRPVGKLLARSEVAYHVMHVPEDYDRPLTAVLEEDGVLVRYDDLRDSRYHEWPFWNRWLSFREIDPIGEAKCRW